MNIWHEKQTLKSMVDLQVTECTLLQCNLWKIFIGVDFSRGRYDCMLRLFNSQFAGELEEDDFEQIALYISARRVRYAFSIELLVGALIEQVTDILLFVRKPYWHGLDYWFCLWPKITWSCSSFPQQSRLDNWSRKVWTTGRWYSWANWTLFQGWLCK